MSNIETAFAPMIDQLEEMYLAEANDQAIKYLDARVEAGLLTERGGWKNIRPLRERFPLGDRYTGIKFTRNEEVGDAKWTQATHHEDYTYVGSVATKFLEKEARQNAEAAYAGFISKFQKKVGDLDNVDVKFVSGGDCQITGEANGKKVVIDQQTVGKYSNRGTFFFQFPARIYVDGQFTPASKYDEAIA